MNFIVAAKCALYVIILYLKLKSYDRNRILHIYAYGYVYFVFFILRKLIYTYCESNKKLDNANSNFIILLYAIVDFLMIKSSAIITNHIYIKINH